MSYTVMTGLDADARGCRTELDAVVDRSRCLLRADEVSGWVEGTRFPGYPTEGAARSAVVLGAARIAYVLHPDGHVTRYVRFHDVNRDLFKSSRDAGAGEVRTSRPTKRVGVAVVVRDLEGRYLMHQRLAGASCDAGLWGVPGGHLECGETVLEAAVREFREETGCELDHATVAAVFDTEEWVAFIVRGRCRGTPVRPDSERDKAEEWQWLSSGEVAWFRDHGLLQSGLKLWFSGDAGVVAAR